MATIKGTFILTAPQMRAAILDLEGVDVADRTLAAWAAYGILVPGVSWPRRKGRYNQRLYSLDDLVKARLLVWLTRKARPQVTMQAARRIVVRLDAERLLLRKTPITVTVSEQGGVTVARPGAPEMVVPSGQMLLPLDDLRQVETAARRAREAA
jgi:hypothetical protein